MNLLAAISQTNSSIRVFATYDFDWTLSGRTSSALVWHSEVARSRLTQCSKSCDLQPALQCAICGAQGALPCVGWGVRPVNWIYRL